MKKTLGLLALVAGGAALVAYALKKNEEKKENEDGNIIHVVEEESEESEEEEQHASYETASYPNLDNADMIALNNVSEEAFETIDFDIMGSEDRPIQHFLHFENRLLMEKFKSIVIEEGFVVTSGEEETDLVVLHISKVNVDLILSRVFYLANLAKECQGTYQKWILK